MKLPWGRSTERTIKIRGAFPETKGHKTGRELREDHRKMGKPTTCQRSWREKHKGGFHNCGITIPASRMPRGFAETENYAGREAWRWMERLHLTQKEYDAHLEMTEEKS